MSQSTDGDTPCDDMTSPEQLSTWSVASSAMGVFFGLTDAVSIAIVSQIGALILAGIAALVSWRTHKAVNSRMDEFKILFAKAKIDEGVLQEKAEQVKLKGEAAVSRAEGAAEAASQANKE